MHLAAVALLGHYVLSDVFSPSTVPPPTPTPPVVTVNNIRSLAELATIEMTAIVDLEDERIPDDLRKHLGSRERILVYGDVKAGFDLSKIRATRPVDRWSLRTTQAAVAGNTLGQHRFRPDPHCRLRPLAAGWRLQAEALEQAKAFLEQAAL